MPRGWQDDPFLFRVERPFLVRDRVGIRFGPRLGGQAPDNVSPLHKLSDAHQTKISHTFNWLSKTGIITFMINIQEGKIN